MATAKPHLATSNKDGLGLLVPASKIHTSYKTELLNTLASPEFTTGQQVDGRAGREPKLVGILATKKDDAKFYSEFTRRSCEQLGINFELRLVGEAREGLGDVEGVEVGVEEAVLEANEDDDVDGIMVYYPIFGGQQDQYIQQVVSPLKDVEGLHHQFLFNLYHNIRFISPSTLKPVPASHLPTSINSNTEDDTPPPGTVKSILPCTPLAIVKVLEYVGVYNRLLSYGDRARGKVVTIVNRSEVVGRPLAALLANDGARVFSVDIDSIVEFTKRPSNSTTSRYNPHHVTTHCSLTLEQCLQLSDVVIGAVPVASYKIPTTQLKDGCVCVNVAQEKNFESDVREKASIYVPSVGQMTIAMLQRNLLRLRKYRDMISDMGKRESAF